MEQFTLLLSGSAPGSELPAGFERHKLNEPPSSIYGGENCVTSGDFFLAGAAI
jgi:hypothetical protein